MAWHHSAQPDHPPGARTKASVAAARRKASVPGAPRVDFHGVPPMHTVSASAPRKFRAGFSAATPCPMSQHGGPLTGNAPGVRPPDVLLAAQRQTADLIRQAARSESAEQPTRVCPTPPHAPPPADAAQAAQAQQRQHIDRRGIGYDFPGIPVMVATHQPMHSPVAGGVPVSSPGQLHRWACQWAYQQVVVRRTSGAARYLSANRLLVTHRITLWWSLTARVTR